MERARGRGGDDGLIVRAVAPPGPRAGRTPPLHDLGKMVRAVAANEDEACLCGISVQRVSTAIWAVTGALSVVSAMAEYIKDHGGVACRKLSSSRTTTTPSTP